MARTLTLADEDGTYSVDLLGGDLQLEKGGWSTKTARDGRIWETFMFGSNAADATIRAAHIEIDKLIEIARDYDTNTVESNAVWLNYLSDGELEKRALIYDGETEIYTDDVFTPLLGIGGSRLTVALQRHNPWENDEDGSYTTSDAAMNAIGATWLIAHDAGTLAQRISHALFTFNTNTKGKVWCGIRELRKGITGFDPIWEAEDGTNLLADTTDQAGGGGHGGNYVNCDFTTATTLSGRFSIKVSQVVGANYDDMIGSYLVLARLKLDADTTEVAVQLRHGWAGYSGRESIVGTTFLSGIDDTTLVNWNFIELGYVDIPPTGNRDSVADSKIDDYFMVLYAERLSAGGELDIDCFVLVPSEHIAVVKSGAFGMNSLDIYTGPDELQYAIGTTTGVIGNVDLSPEKWNYPVGGGILVLVAQGATQSLNLTDTVDVALTMFPRWKTYREAITT